MSASLGTMDRTKIKIPDSQIYDHYEYSNLQEIIDNEKATE